MVADLRAQQVRKGIKSLSRPEKCWVAAHPFIAKKAWRCTQQVRYVTDSIEKAGTLRDGNGGQLDAFRHAFWMASLAQIIPAKKAIRLGKAHEKGNYIDFKKGRLEENARPDSLAGVMDLRNNEAGIDAGKNYRADTAANKISLEESIVHLVWDGKLTIVKKDAAGNILSCEGNRVEAEKYTGKWFIPKCLVSSDLVQVMH
ncbi:MAG TPA: hypothetical protein VI731_07830 [Bacteroidia bacterium]|nr:hypothetical protein [Bacteroidia bacterium]